MTDTNSLPPHKEFGELPDHSPLGASAAERWMNCPGSVNLVKRIPKREHGADPEYRTDGTAAHDAISYCLTGARPEPWELIGEKFGDARTEVTMEMAEAITVFVDICEAIEADAEKTYVETLLNDPDNKWCYGRIDFGAVKQGTLYVRDYKHGQGIVVDTKHNQQMLYYAYLLLLKQPDVRYVNMLIVQPRIPHDLEEPWEVSAEYVMEWARDVMLPAMKRTETDDTLSPGQHCRFCEAKESLLCPKLQQLYKDTAADDPDKLALLTDEELVRLWPNMDPVKMFAKAVEKETLQRLMNGKMQDNGMVKLVNKKANRVWKPEAAEVFKERFGEKVWNAPEFKSPAEMEKIDPAAKKIVHEYAYTPQSGYTVAEIDDKRPGVSIRTVTETLGAALAEIE